MDTVGVLERRDPCRGGYVRVKDPPVLPGSAEDESPLLECGQRPETFGIGHRDSTKGGVGDGGRFG